MAIKDGTNTFTGQPVHTEMPDMVTVWAEIDGIMRLVGERMRQSNGKLKMKWKFPRKVLAEKIMYLQPC